MNSTQIGTTIGAVSPEMPATTSIGRKIWMAISGFVLVGFVCGHMLGNLQVFLGQDQLNTYAEKLHAIPALLWSIRFVMLTVVLIHIIDGIWLWLGNNASRPIAYERRQFKEATLASRTMIWTGLGILLYVVYHLLHFTLIVTNPEYAGLRDVLGRPDVYSMVVMGFQNYLISGVYFVAVIFLAFHLSHAISSLFQTLGWNTIAVQPILKRIAYTVSILLFLGYTSIPVAIVLGLVTLPGGGH